MLFLPFIGFSALESGFQTWRLGDVPFYEEIFSLEEETFNQLFAIKSAEKNIMFEIYSTTGQRIPSNIYRYHKNGEITYEIGRGLKEGLYIVKMSSKDKDQYIKLIRFGY